MGGVLATLPAYESDLFGPRHVGAIHSRSQKSGVLGKLGPGKLGPGQLGPRQLGPGQLGPGQSGPVIFLLFFIMSGLFL